MIILYEKGEHERVDLLRFSPDGQSLLASSYDGIRIWRGLPNPDPRVLLSDSRYHSQNEFTPDGRKLLIIRQHGLLVLDMAYGQSQSVELWNNWSCFLGLTSDGRHVLLAQNNRPLPHGWIACCPVDDPTPNAAVWSRELSQSIRFGPVCLADERFVLVATHWDTSRFRSVFRYTVCSITIGEPLTMVEGPELGWQPPVVSADGRVLASVFNARIVVLAADNFATPLAVVRNDNRKYFTSIAFHPSGKYLAATSNDATVKLYDTATWELAKTFTWDIGRMRSIAFSPDGTLAAAGSDKGKVVIWDVDL